MEARTKVYLRLREGPGTNFPIRRVIGPGKVVKVLRAEGDWWEVEVGGERGYMAARFLEPLPAPAAPGASLAEAILGLDLSFSRLPEDEAWAVGAGKILGRPVRALVQNLWTGWRTPEAAWGNLERMARWAGVGAGVYIVVNPGLEPQKLVPLLLSRAFERHPGVRWAFLDVEPSPTIPAGGLTGGTILRWAEAVLSWREREGAMGLRLGVYTGLWVWERAGRPDWSGLLRFPLWLARYTGRFPEPLPREASFGPYRWEMAGWQYQGTTMVRVAGFGPVAVDLNAFHREAWETEAPGA